MNNVGVIKFVDRVVGSILALLLSIFKSKKPVKIEEGALFIQLWSIGETILTIPAIKAVKNSKVLCTSRNFEVYMAAGINYEIISMNPLGILAYIVKNFKRHLLVVDMEEYLNVSAILSFFIGRKSIGFSTGIRHRLYDNAIEYNDKQHVTRTFLDLVNGKETEIGKLKYSKESETKVMRLVGGKKFIAVVPGVAESGKARMWPLMQVTELCRRIIDKTEYKIVIVGGKSDEDICKNIILKNKSSSLIDSCGKLNMDELFCLIDKASLVVSNDTGPVHIASAQKTKTVALYGPNSPVRFGALCGMSIYHPECKYSPCINVHKGEVPDCLPEMKKIEYQKCMKNISVDEVFLEIRKLC